jgi:ABC-type Fe3+/spermidine/putrescine transport system ATPase subunit
LKFQVEGLTKLYRSTAVVNNVTFGVDYGQIVGYLGPNGSGKSTTVKMLTGLVEPDRGQIHFDGVNVRKEAIAFKRRLAYVPEEAHVHSALAARSISNLSAAELHSDNAAAPIGQVPGDPNPHVLVCAGLHCECSQVSTQVSIRIRVEYLLRQEQMASAVARVMWFAEER